MTSPDCNGNYFSFFFKKENDCNGKRENGLKRNQAVYS